MSTTETTTTEPTTDPTKIFLKIKSDATIGSQITRARALLDKGKLDKNFTVQGIGTKAGTTAIIVAQNVGTVTEFDAIPYTTPQGHRSLQITVKVDTVRKPPSKDLSDSADKFWNVCVPDTDRNQSIASSCRALDAKLETLEVDETLVLRGAGQALNVMIVFYSYIQTEWLGCEITGSQFKNNVITNRDTGRKNKKTLMSFVVKRNSWEEGDEEEDEEEGDDEEESD